MTAPKPAAGPVPLLCSLPGAGVLIFWQLGVMKALQARYDLSKVPLLGSSSGSVVVAAAKSGVCLDTAAQKGIDLIRQRVLTRPLGWFGIVGRLTRRWLHDVLPDDAGQRCSAGAANLLVTTLPFLRHHLLSDFRSKSDVIDCAMASAHIPLVCDPRLWVHCRWLACLDGGLWWLLQRSEAEYRPAFADNTLLITPFEDQQVIKDLHLFRRIKPADVSALSSLMHMGEEFAVRLAADNHQLLQPYALSYQPPPGLSFLATYAQQSQHPSQPSAAVTCTRSTLKIPCQVHGVRRV